MVELIFYLQVCTCVCFNETLFIFPKQQKVAVRGGKERRWKKENGRGEDGREEGEDEREEGGKKPLCLLNLQMPVLSGSVASHTQ